MSRGGGRGSSTIDDVKQEGAVNRAADFPCFRKMYILRFCPTGEKLWEFSRGYFFDYSARALFYEEITLHTTPHCCDMTTNIAPKRTAKMLKGEGGGGA